MSFSGEQQVDGFHETITITRRKFLTDFENVDESFIDDLTIESLLEYIERQRLTFMPPRGSHWDKVLKWAEFFALQISGYATVVEPFMPESKAAAQLIWTASRSLVHVRFLSSCLSSGNGGYQVYCSKFSARDMTMLVAIRFDNFLNQLWAAMGCWCICIEYYDQCPPMVNAENHRSN